MDTFQIISAASMAILVAINLYLLYVKGYLSKKGENLATKEDIQQITKLQGEVLNDLEKLKHNRISFDEKKREVIMNLFSSISILVDVIYFSQMQITGKNFLEENERNNRQLHSSYYSFISSKSKVDLFVDDTSVLDNLYGIQSLLGSIVFSHTAICKKIQISFEGNSSDFAQLENFAEEYMSNVSEKQKEFIPFMGELNKKLKKLLQGMM